MRPHNRIRRYSNGTGALSIRYYVVRRFYNELFTTIEDSLTDVAASLRNSSYSVCPIDKGVVEIRTIYVYVDTFRA